MHLDTPELAALRPASGPARATTTRGGITRAVQLTVVAIAALSLSGCFGGGGPEGGPSGASTAGQPASPSATRATFALSVGLQPTHLNEKVVLEIDGQQLADWATDPSNPSRILTLSDVPTGDQRYELTGTYAQYDAKGFLEEKAVQGSGTIAIADGGFYGLYYDAAQDVFELQRLR